MARMISAAVLSAVAIVLAFGCVLRTEHTIHATVDVNIRHIEEQADDLLNFIEGGDPAAEEEKKAEGDKAANENAFTPFLRWAKRMAGPMPRAHAAELKSVSSDKIIEIAKKLKERHPKIQALKNKQVLGEDNRGYVALREEAEEAKAYLSDSAKKNEAQQLVAAENADRKALYNETARLQDDPAVTLTLVEQVYAKKRLERASSGEIFQLPPEGEFFQEVKRLAHIKKLGDKAKPNAWVTIP